MSFGIEMDVSVESERLFIRRFVPGDWQDLYEYLSQDSICRYQPYDAFTKECAKREAASRSSDHYWAVCMKENNKLIGDVYLHTRKYGVWELGYAINEKYQKNGFAMEAVEALVDDAFRNKGAHRIEAMCDPQNVASWKLLERIGFRREGHLLQDTCFKDDEGGRPIWTDTFVYGILESEWRKETKTGISKTVIRIR